MMKERYRPLIAALLTSMSASFLLCGYEFIRSASNTLYKVAYGPQNLPVIMSLVPFVVIFMLYGYGRLLSWLGPRKTLLTTSLLSGVAIVFCYACIQSGFRVGTAFLYLIREAYVVLLIEQYWSFLNSTLGSSNAKKMNGPIIGVSSLGAVLGGLLVHQLAEPLGTVTMLLFGAAAVVPAALLSDMAYSRCGEPKPSETESEKQTDPLSIKLFQRSRLLLFLFLLIITTQIISTVLGLNFQNILHSEIPNMDAQTAYSGKFFALLNGSAAFLQFIVAPLALRFLPLGLIHAAIPFVHIVAASAIILSPSLTTAGLGYFLFKIFDYSLFRAAKEILYIPLSFDARYRAKEVIDVFGYRVSKGGTSLAILLLQRVGIVFAPLYGWVALAASGLWMIILTVIFRQAETKTKEKPALFEPTPDVSS